MYDELALDTLGDKKTALFLIMSDTDSTFNFLISMVYTQLFNLLCDKADDVYGGKLPIHVRCLIDECANIGQMIDLKKHIHDSANGLDYTLVNDHYLPNLTVAAPAEHPTGRWGRLHKMYLKEQHPIRYNQLLLSGELGGYLAKLDKQTEEQLALTIRQMQEAEGVTEALKAADQLEWVRRMNNIRNRAEEIVYNEIVYK